MYLFSMIQLVVFENTDSYLIGIQFSLIQFI